MNTIMVKRARLFAAAAVVFCAFSGAAGAQTAMESEMCRKAADCKGPLPQICMRCKGDGEACAHWTCVRRHCVMQICGNQLTKY